MPLESRLPEIIAQSGPRITVALERACKNIETRAKARSRVDTGLMRSSWTYELLGPYEARVYNPVEYTIYNEYGTRFMSAQPMMWPAMLETREEFEAEVSRAWSIV